MLVAPGAAGDLYFDDRAGDAGAAPDIRDGSVTSDRAGNVTFTVTTNQRTLAPDAAITVYVDADRSASTGLPYRGLGVDHFFTYGGGLGLPFLWHVLGDHLVIDFQSTLSFAYDGALTARVNTSDLGETDQFHFFVESEQQDAEGETLAADFAPDSGYFEHALPAELVITVGRPTPVSGRPLAGKPVVVGAPVTRSDGVPFTSGSVHCTAMIRSARLRATGRVVSGSARCSIRIPANARGKRLRGTTAVRVEGAELASRAFALRIG